MEGIGDWDIMASGNWNQGGKDAKSTFGLNP